MDVKQITPETSYIIDPIAPGISKSDLNQLLQKYHASSRRRHRYCFHQSPTVDLHDIVICYDSSSYIPPNKHVGKVESLLVLQGEIDFFLFSDNGLVYDRRRLSASNDSLPFYIRVPPNTWHGLRAVGDQPCIIKETIAGPYDSSTLKWASFAPSEADGSATGFDWYDKLAQFCDSQSILPPEDEVFEKVTDSVFRSNRQITTVSLEQLNPIIKAAQVSTLKRARLCCHSGSEEKLQEMFIALAPGVDIEESMHLRKDESLTVVSGTGSYLFPNEDGSLRYKTQLSPISGDHSVNSRIYTRINRYVPHKIIVDSSTLLIHEATTGPFDRADTEYRISGV